MLFLILSIILIGFGGTSAFDCTGKIGFTCDPDCKTIHACGLSPEPKKSDICSEVIAGAPFCDAGACVATEPATCGAPPPPDPNAFYCSSEGTFPDPIDCTKYHYCSDNGAVAVTTTCAPTYTYISSLRTCQRGSVCQKVDCSAKANRNQFIVNPHDPGYYAYCRGNADGTVTALMLKCEDEISYVYDAKEKTCVFNCKTDTNYVDRSNCNNYISCYKVSGKFKYLSTPCPPDYYFNGSAGRCTLENGTKCQSEIV